MPVETSGRVSVLKKYETFDPSAAWARVVREARTTEGYLRSFGPFEFGARDWIKKRSARACVTERSVCGRCGAFVCWAWGERGRGRGASRACMWERGSEGEPPRRGAWAGHTRYSSSVTCLPCLTCDSYVSLLPPSLLWSPNGGPGWCLVLRAVPTTTVTPVQRSKAPWGRDWVSPRGPQASLGSLRRISVRTLALAVRVV